MARVKARVMVWVRVRIAHYQLAELGEVQGANLTLTLTLTLTVTRTLHLPAG